MEATLPNSSTSSEHLTMQNDLKKFFVKSLFAGLLTTAGALVAGGTYFYYNTLDRLSDVEKTTIELKAVQTEHTQTLNKVAVFEIELKNMQLQMTAIQDGQKEMYKLLFEINKEIRK